MDNTLKQNRETLTAHNSELQWYYLLNLEASFLIIDQLFSREKMHEQ